MKVKKLASAVLATLMVFGLTGCANGGQTSTSNSGAVTTGSGTTAQANYDVDSLPIDGEVTVRFCSRVNPDGGDPESDYITAKVKEWNAEKNGITIEPIFIATETDYLNRLATDMASGDTPSIFMQYGGTNCLDYVEADAILNLQPYLDASPEWKNGIVKENWTCGDFSEYGYEGQYAVPWSAFEILLYYNEEYLKACGLEVPTTWDELLNCCKVLTENGYQPFKYGEGTNYKYAHHLSVMAAKAYGPDFQHKLAAREYTYESPEMLDLMTKMKEMQDAGYFGENILSVDAVAERTYFGAGESAFMVDLSRGGAVLADSEGYKNGTIHAAKFPSINPEYAGVSMGGASSGYFVTKLNKTVNEINASLKVIKWLTSTEFVDGLVKTYANTYSVIPSKGVIDNYLFEECNELMGSTTAYVGELAQASTNTAELTIVRDALQLLVSGSTPEEVGAEITKKLSDYE